MHHRRTNILFAIILFILIGMNFPSHAQSFNASQMDRIRSEIMRSGLATSATSAADLPKAQKEIQNQLTSVTSKPASSTIKFPGAQDVLVKSDVAHINPNTYILGPGDQMVVVFFGMISQRIPTTVQPDGTIFIEPAAPIKVQGLTISKAKKKIYLELQRYYRNFNIDLQMTALRTFQVEVLGEVTNPGTYVVTPTVGACDLIGLANGLKETASVRNIVLTDLVTGKSKRIDVFTWFFLGHNEQNLCLSHKSKLYVPLMQQKVMVEGAFKRNGYFEIVTNERLRDLVKIVEPATGAVMNEAKITRINGDNNLKIIPVNLQTILENSSSNENIHLVDGDKLFVPDLTVFLDKITVVGELEGANLFSKTVNRLTGQEEILKTGLYKLREDEKVKDVVIALGGLTVQADQENARIERPEQDGTLKVIPVNLHKLMNLDDETQNLALLPGDSLIVPAKQTNVYILGEIRSPGMYKYNVGNQIKEYVALAGGPTAKARLKQTKVIQKVAGKTVVKTIDLRSILTGNQIETFELRPGDVIYIPYADISSWHDIVNAIADIIVLQRLVK